MVVEDHRLLAKMHAESHCLHPPCEAYAAAQRPAGADAASKPRGDAFDTTRAPFAPPASAGAKRSSLVPPATKPAQTYTTASWRVKTTVEKAACASSLSCSLAAPRGSAQTGRPPIAWPARGSWPSCVSRRLEKPCGAHIDLSGRKSLLWMATSPTKTGSSVPKERWPFVYLTELIVRGSQWRAKSSWAQG